MIHARVSFPRILRGLGYGLSVLAPAALLLGGSSRFSQDWPDHLWIIDYYSAYFRQHGSLPEFMNAAQAVGSPLPLFYGRLFYSAMGVLAAAVGIMTAVRLAVVAMTAAQFFAVFSAGRKIFGQTRMSYVVAVSGIWGTYVLTNLYNRGAIAEFFATGFVVTAIGFAASAAVTAGSTRLFHGWLAGLFLLFAAATHPPTAVLTAIFLVLLALGWVVGGRRGGIGLSRRDVFLGVGGILAGVVVLSPWIYACALFSRKLVVAQHYPKFAFRPDHSDTFWGRFAPFPYDSLSNAQGALVADTPYLETSINVVLLGLFLWNLVLWRRNASNGSVGKSTRHNGLPCVVMWLAAAWFVLLAAISISPDLAALFEFMAPSIQFVYRLVSHCNAALLVAVFASGILVVRSGGYGRHESQTNQVLAAALAVALLGFGVKMQHAAAVALPGDPVPPAAEQQLAVAVGYSTPWVMRDLSDDEMGNAPILRFPGYIHAGHLGEIGSLRISLKDAAWLQTNVVVFPWVEIMSDGKKLPAAQVARAGAFTAVHLSAGQHELQPVWRPDPVWSFLRPVSESVFVLLLLGTVVWAVVRLRSRRDAITPT